MKSAIQKLNKSTVFHQRNRYGRNLQIMATILTRISAEPVDRLRAAVAQGESAAHSGRRLKNSGSANAAREIASG